MNCNVLKCSINVFLTWTWEPSCWPGCLSLFRCCPPYWDTWVLVLGFSAPHVGSFKLRFGLIFPLEFCIQKDFDVACIQSGFHTVPNLKCVKILLSNKSHQLSSYWSCGNKPVENRIVILIRVMWRSVVSFFWKTNFWSENKRYLGRYSFRFATISGYFLVILTGHQYGTCRTLFQCGNCRNISWNSIFHFFQRKFYLTLNFSEEK